jgi:hypothetical protein
MIYNCQTVTLWFNVDISSKNGLLRWFFPCFLVYFSLFWIKFPAPICKMRVHNHVNLLKLVSFLMIWKLQWSHLFSSRETRHSVLTIDQFQILSAISKIFEKLISMQLSEYLESNEIFTGEQSAGFRKYHSTQSSLLQATNKWLINMDIGCLNGVIFLHLKIVHVDHDILLRKLYLYGSSLRG